MNHKIMKSPRITSYQGNLLANSGRPVISVEGIMMDV